MEIKDLDNAIFALFRVKCKNPEFHAWEKMKSFTKSHVKDYKERKYIGFATHDHADDSRSGSDDNFHEYCAMIQIQEHEISTFENNGLEIIQSINSKYVLDNVEIVNDNDMGKSLENTYFKMIDWLNVHTNYIFDSNNKYVLEEHIFADTWVSGPDGLKEFILWLPIKENPTTALN